MLGVIPGTTGQMLKQSDGILNPCITDYEEIASVVHTGGLETLREWANIDWIS